MKDDGSALRGRIAALLKMTTSAGCSEAEAMAAAAKAAALMREFGLSQLDLELTETDVQCSTGIHSPRAPLWVAVARCTNTSCIYLSGTKGVWRFFGRDPGTEIASYLVVVLDRSISREIRLFKKSETYRARRNDKTRRAAVHDFTNGMVSRLSLRLFDIFRFGISRKVELEAQAMRDQFCPERRMTPQKRSKARFNDAVNAGWGAGWRVPLSHGVNGGAVARIGVDK